MEQQHQGFSDSTPKTGNDKLQKIGKKFPLGITILYPAKLAPKSMDQIISTFLNSKKISSYRRTESTLTTLDLWKKNDSGCKLLKPGK